MTRNDVPTDSRAPLSLSDLFAGYLERQERAAQAVGVGYADAAQSEAVPHDAVPVQPVDPQLAWNDALAVALPPGNAPTAVDLETVPPEWPALVNQSGASHRAGVLSGQLPQLVHGGTSIRCSASRTSHPAQSAR